MIKALLVEDDQAIRESLTQSLRELGYVVTGGAEGAGAMATVLNSDPDVVLLDLGLPDIDGSTVLSMLRAVSAVPVIVVTARVGDEDIVRLLNLGADDYVTKPFAVAQLDARIRAVLRRADRAVSAHLLVGALSIDTRRRRVTLDGRPVELRNLEYQLLLILALGAGEVVSAASLTGRLWGESTTESVARLDVHLSRLRTSLGESARHPRYLQRVRGVGVRLAAPED